MIGGEHFMNCKHCGKELSKESKFCKFCGLEQTGSKIVESKMQHSDHMTEKEQYAGFWIRLGAYLIDFIGVMLFALVIRIIMAVFGISSLTESIGILFDYIVWVIYSSFFLSAYSYTPGKKLFGLTVTTENGDKLDFKTSLTRAFIQPLSLLFLGAGYWNMSKDEKKQAWHDKQSHTVVIIREKVNYIIPIILSIIGICAYLYLTSLNNSK